MRYVFIQKIYVLKGSQLNYAGIGNRIEGSARGPSGRVFT